MNRKKLDINELWDKFFNWRDRYIAKSDAIIEKVSNSEWTGDTIFLSSHPYGDPGADATEFDPEWHKKLIRDKTDFLHAYFVSVSYDGTDYLRRCMRLLPLQLPSAKRNSIGVFFQQDVDRENISAPDTTRFMEWDASLFAKQIGDIDFGWAHSAIPFDYIFLQNFTDKKWSRRDAELMAKQIKEDMESNDLEFVVKTDFSNLAYLSLVFIWDPTDPPVSELEDYPMVAKTAKKTAPKKTTKKVAKKVAAKKAAKTAATKKQTPSRYRAARKDAAISSIIRQIQKAFKLPEGSVKLVLPNGTKAHVDGRIKNLLARWDAVS